MKQYPEIQAWEYEESCGNTHLGTGILMVVGDENFCKLTQGTIQEKDIALLWQASPKLLEWSKEAVEETESFYEKHDDLDPPSWLAELRAAVDYAEKGELKY